MSEPNRLNGLVKQCLIEYMEYYARFGPLGAMNEWEGDIWE